MSDKVCEVLSNFRGRFVVFFWCFSIKFGHFLGFFRCFSRCFSRSKEVKGRILGISRSDSLHLGESCNEGFSAFLIAWRRFFVFSFVRGGFGVTNIFSAFLIAWRPFLGRFRWDSLHTLQKQVV